MTTILSRILALATLLYSTGVFVFWTFDPGVWTSTGREFLAGLFFILTLTIFALHGENQK